MEIALQLKITDELILKFPNGKEITVTQLDHPEAYGNIIIMIPSSEVKLTSEGLPSVKVAASNVKLEIA